MAAACGIIDGEQCFGGTWCLNIL